MRYICFLKHFLLYVSFDSFPVFICLTKNEYYPLDDVYFFFQFEQDILPYSRRWDFELYIGKIFFVVLDHCTIIVRSLYDHWLSASKTEANICPTRSFLDWEVQSVKNRETCIFSVIHTVNLFRQNFHHKGKLISLRSSFSIWIHKLCQKYWKEETIRQRGGQNGRND